MNYILINLSLNFDEHLTAPILVVQYYTIPVPSTCPQIYSWSTISVCIYFTVSESCLKAPHFSVNWFMRPSWSCTWSSAYAFRPSARAGVTRCPSYLPLSTYHSALCLRYIIMWHISSYRSRTSSFQCLEHACNLAHWTQRATLQGEQGEMLMLMLLRTGTYLCAAQ